MLDWWEQSERRAVLRARLTERDGIDPNDVILDPASAARRGLTSTVCFPHGNLAPEGSVIKSTAIDPGVVDADGVYRKAGRRVYSSPNRGRGRHKKNEIKKGDVLVIMCRGPLGSGMEETYPGHIGP